MYLSLDEYISVLSEGLSTYLEGNVGKIGGRFHIEDLYLNTAVYVEVAYAAQNAFDNMVRSQNAEASSNS